MIGDRSWAELLYERYRQHVADSIRRDRECLPFEQWAVSRTWRDFCNLARLCRTIPQYTLDQWETYNPVPGADGSSYSSTVLARRLIDGLVLTRAALTHLYRVSRRSHAAVKAYLDDGRIQPGQERALGQGRRLIYDWLIRAAETEKVLSQSI